jgi:acyl-CoA synthetase (AMP-forming)/AMP-acid ligase II
VPEVTLRIIPISDGPIEHWDESLPLPAGQVGEIVVRGPAVTKTYVGRPQSTALAKIRDGDAIWHRMGDLGYLDEAGRLWFYGRKSQRVITATGTLYTEPVELLFNRHPALARSALVGVPGRESGAGQGVGATLPVVIVEPKEKALLREGAARARLLAELRGLAASVPMTAEITIFLLHPAFPVDIRHNAKIFREQLAAWAARALS